MLLELSLFRRTGFVVVERNSRVLIWTVLLYTGHDFYCIWRTKGIANGWDDWCDFLRWIPPLNLPDTVRFVLPHVDICWMGRLEAGNFSNIVVGRQRTCT